MRSLPARAALGERLSLPGAGGPVTAPGLEIARGPGGRGPSPRLVEEQNNCATLPPGEAEKRAETGQVSAAYEHWRRLGVEVPDPSSVRACLDGSWTLATWDKGTGRNPRHRPHTDGTWRCPKCAPYASRREYARLLPALQAWPREPETTEEPERLPLVRGKRQLGPQRMRRRGGLVFIVLSFKKDAAFKAEVTPAQSYPMMQAARRRVLRECAGEFGRGDRYGRRATEWDFYWTNEAHADGYCHSNLIAACPLMWDAAEEPPPCGSCELALADLRARGKSELGHARCKQCESPLQRRLREICAGNGLGWRVHVSRVRSVEDVASYASKVVKLGAEVSKISQVPLPAPLGTRRLGYSRGFGVVKRSKAEDRSGCLYFVPAALAPTPDRLLATSGLPPNATPPPIPIPSGRRGELWTWELYVLNWKVWHARVTADAAAGRDDPKLGGVVPGVLFPGPGGFERGGAGPVRVEPPARLGDPVPPTLGIPHGRPNGTGVLAGLRARPLVGAEASALDGFPAYGSDPEDRAVGVWRLHADELTAAHGLPRPRADVVGVPGWTFVRPTRDTWIDRARDSGDLLAAALGPVEGLTAAERVELEALDVQRQVVAELAAPFPWEESGEPLTINASSTGVHGHDT